MARGEVGESRFPEMQVQVFERKEIRKDKLDASSMVTIARCQRSQKLIRSRRMIPKYNFVSIRGAKKGPKWKEGRKSGRAM